MDPWSIIPVERRSTSGFLKRENSNVRPSAPLIRVLNPLHAIRRRDTVGKRRQRARRISHHRRSRLRINLWLWMHRSSGRWSRLLAIMLHLLIHLMVLTTQSFILAPYDFQLVAEPLQLHTRIATLFCALLQVSDVVGSCTKVQSDGNDWVEPWNVPFERISHLLDLLP